MSKKDAGLATPIVPSQEAVEFVARTYPNHSAAEKYRLAQAQTLIDWFNASRATTNIGG